MLLFASSPGGRAEVLDVEEAGLCRRPLPHPLASELRSEKLSEVLILLKLEMLSRLSEVLMTCEKLGDPPRWTR